jgi:hypothetical protein
MIKAFRALGRLSKPQRAALDRMRLSGHFAVGPLLDDLRALAEYDRQADAWRASAVKLLALLFVCTFFGIFATVITRGLLWPLPLAFVSAGLLIGWSLVRLKKSDISNNVREVALPFLSIIKQDLAPDQSIQLQLDLALPTDKQKCVKKLPAYQRGPYRAVDSTFRDPWFQGSARLHDGVVVRWRIADEVLESKRTKRNPRGKIKTKTRHYKRSLIAVAVSLPTKTYRVQQQPALPPDQKLSVSQGERRCTLKFQRKVKAKSLDPINPRLLIDAIMSAYGATRPAT